MDKAKRLGTQPIGKLLLQFSIPAIIGMFVNSLYNIVDRLYVGNAMGEAALGGLGLAMPLMNIILAFCMLFGIGTANFISVKLGEKKPEEAENALCHCFYLLLVTGIILTGIGLLLLKPLFLLIGANPAAQSFDYAVNYMRIIFCGTVFNMLGFGFSHCARAQGFPNVTMTAMLIGAVTNIVLDPIFIFLLKMGVEGAAYATVISQFIAMVFILYFAFSQKAIVHLNLKKFRFSPRIVGKISVFGFSPFLLQLAISLSSFLFNAKFIEYGALYFGDIKGGDIAIASFNIAGSVLMLILMPVFGINQGVQPVIGYNYGAKQYDRVLKAYKIAAVSATIITVVGFVACEIFAPTLVRMFYSGAEKNMLDFAVMTMRISFAGIAIVGFQTVSANYFVMVGKPIISSFLMLSRPVLILIPCIYIFSALFQIKGLFWANPVGDVVATTLTAIFIFREIKDLKRKIRLKKERVADVSSLTSDL